MRLIFPLLLIFQVLSLKAQLFFDKNGIRTTEPLAYYSRPDVTGSQSTWHYTSNNATYFEGILLSSDNQNETTNKYKGSCKWFYKNGNLKQTATFNNEGLADGVTTTFYESGKKWKETEYSNGKKKNDYYKEFNEDGSGYKIFEEEFDNNNLDWDLYASDKSESIISDSKLTIISHSKNGTSRYVNMSYLQNEFILETQIKGENLQDVGKHGILFGFKDWQNYNFLLISGTYFYLGFVFEGITSYEAEGMFSSAIKEKDFNNIKILCSEKDMIIAFNGEVVYKTSRYKSFGSSIGYLVAGRTKMSAERLIIKLPEDNGTEPSLSPEDKNISASGSGLLLSGNGYIITNHHVIQDAKTIIVDVYNDGSQKSYKAKLIAQDPANDLAVIKISDTLFHSSYPINYKLKGEGLPEIGSSAYTIGYPMALSGMGKEPKFSDGRISSKTGYNNDINSFQTTIPVQPGNSGGPVFNDRGELIGLINARISNADNVSYAIKLNYIKSLLETLPEDLKFQSSTDLSTLKLEDQIKNIINFVVLIKLKK